MKRSNWTYGFRREDDWKCWRMMNKWWQIPGYTESSKKLSERWDQRTITRAIILQRRYSQLQFLCSADPWTTVSKCERLDENLFDHREMGQTWSGERMTNGQTDKVITIWSLFTLSRRVPNNMVGDIKSNHRLFKRFTNTGSQKNDNQGLLLQKRQMAVVLPNLNLKQRRSLIAISWKYSLRLSIVMVCSANIQNYWTSARHWAWMNYILEFLKNLQQSLVQFSQYQQSLNTGEIPREWSLVNICPSLKKQWVNCLLI